MSKAHNQFNDTKRNDVLYLFTELGTGCSLISVAFHLLPPTSYVDFFV